MSSTTPSGPLNPVTTLSSRLRSVTLEISVRAHDLVQMNEWMHLPFGVVAMYEEDQRRPGEFKLIDHTEVVPDDHSPTFAKRFRVTHETGHSHRLMFRVFDVDEPVVTNQDLMGVCAVDLDDFVRGPTKVLPDGKVVSKPLVAQPGEWAHVPLRNPLDSSIDQALQQQGSTFSVRIQPAPPTDLLSTLNESEGIRQSEGRVSIQEPVVVQKTVLVGPFLSADQLRQVEDETPTSGPFARSGARVEVRVGLENLPLTHYSTGTRTAPVLAVFKWDAQRGKYVCVGLSEKRSPSSGTPVSTSSKLRSSTRRGGPSASHSTVFGASSIGPDGDTSGWSVWFDKRFIMDYAESQETELKVNVYNAHCAASVLSDHHRLGSAFVKLNVLVAGAGFTHYYELRNDRPFYTPGASTEVKSLIPQALESTRSPIRVVMQCVGVVNERGLDDKKSIASAFQGHPLMNSEGQLSGLSSTSAWILTENGLCLSATMSRVMELMASGRVFTAYSRNNAQGRFGRPVRVFFRRQRPGIRGICWYYLSSGPEGKKRRKSSTSGPLELSGAGATTPAVQSLPGQMVAGAPQFNFIPLSLITDVVVGKATKELQQTGAEGALQSRCFSLLVNALPSSEKKSAKSGSGTVPYVNPKTGQVSEQFEPVSVMESQADPPRKYAEDSLHLEAGSRIIRDAWAFGLLLLTRQYKMSAAVETVSNAGPPQGRVDTVAVHDQRLAQRLKHYAPSTYLERPHLWAHGSAEQSSANAAGTPAVVVTPAHDKSAPADLNEAKGSGAAGENTTPVSPSRTDTPLEPSNSQPLAKLTPRSPVESVKPTVDQTALARKEAVLARVRELLIRGVSLTLKSGSTQGEAVHLAYRPPSKTLAGEEGKDGGADQLGLLELRFVTSGNITLYPLASFRQVFLGPQVGNFQKAQLEGVTPTATQDDGVSFSLVGVKPLSEAPLGLDFVGDAPSARVAVVFGLKGLMEKGGKDLVVEYFKA